MDGMIFAAKQNRTIPKEDKIFGISNRAKAMIAKEGKDKVVNATIGALLDDHGELIVLSSVAEVFQSLTPKEFAEYAPISGVPAFREAALKDAFGDFKPQSYTAAVAAPGGTGALRNAIANYSERGDKILVADWYWAPYNTIAQELGRGTETFAFFSDERKFNVADFEQKVEALLAAQDRLVIILNTPAHNPTGYSLTDEDWQGVAAVLKKHTAGKKVALVVDIAYIEFSGHDHDPRNFFPILETLPETVLPLISHSFSKTFTLYGMRCGALICMAKTPEIAEEFRQVCEFSSRASWSNCARAPQMIVAKIYADPALKARVDEEREGFRAMLLRRGKAFETAAQAVGLEIVPFDAGFFVSIPCANPDAVSAELEKDGIFLVPLAKGVRVSVASIPEVVCAAIPAKIKVALDRIEGR